MAGASEMASALDRILAYKGEEVAARRRTVTEGEMAARAAAAPAPRGFAAALSAVAGSGGNALICELKRKSPSAGEILPGADPLEIARDYAAGGAACLSILTDEPSFGGSLADLEAVRGAVDLPLLRKDFMIDPWQVLEARAHGADAVLVILAALGDIRAREITDAAIELGMDVLLEVHDRPELERALALPSPLIGINNRNLKTMTTDLAMTEALAPALPEDRQLVSESGIAAPDDILRLRKSGARRFLIGESLMTQADRTGAVRGLRAARSV